MISVQVTSAKTIKAPHTVQPGLVQLHNAGSRSFYVYKSRSSDLATFLKDFNGPTPVGLLHHFFAVDHVLGSSDVYATLSNGTYYLVDGDVFPIKKSWVSTMKVTGPVSNDHPPAAAQTVTIDARDTLDVPTALSRTKPVRLTLASEHDQVVHLFRIPPSVSTKVIDDFIAHPDPDKYESLKPKPDIVLAALDAPQTIWTSLPAPAGRYVIFNLSYNDDGRLFFKHGHARKLTIG